MLGVQKPDSATELIQRHQGDSPKQTTNYLGLEVHMRTVSCCVRDGSGAIYADDLFGLAEGIAGRDCAVIQTGFEPLHTLLRRAMRE